jgi:hypothetical protein
MSDMEKYVKIDTVRQVEQTMRGLGAVGRESAWPLKCLLPHMRDIGLGGEDAPRTLRSVISAAPRHGIAIVSCNKGYYIAETLTDLELCIQDLKSREHELFKRRLDIIGLQGAFVGAARQRAA